MRFALCALRYAVLVAMKINYLAFNSKPQNLMLKNDEIHVWYVSLDQQVSRLQRMESILSVDERMRAERYHFKRDRNRFVISHGILRTIIGWYLNIEAGKLQFCYGKHGKPALADTFGNGRICFNSSRSEGLALYAFARDRAIGVDIENIRDIYEMEQIAERIFSEKEKSFFHSLPESKKKEAFFNCWTRKEAVVKAIGDGFHLPFNRFDVSLSRAEPARLLAIQGDTAKASKWHLEDLKTFSGFVAACVVEGGCRIRSYQWSA